MKEKLAESIIKAGLRLEEPYAELHELINLIEDQDERNKYLDDFTKLMTHGALIMLRAEREYPHLNPDRSFASSQEHPEGN